MGIYLNPGAEAFQMAISSKIYVDKTELLLQLNSILNTERRFICISRPRRFGKSMTANMICAYYDHTVDGEAVFGNLKIAQVADGMIQQGQYDVVRINMQDFLSEAHDVSQMLARLQKRIAWDIKRTYPNIEYFDLAYLADVLAVIGTKQRRMKHCRFILISMKMACVMRLLR